MVSKLKNNLLAINIKFLSIMAAFAFSVTTIAVNLRCMYVLHEEQLPEDYKKFRKF